MAKEYIDKLVDVLHLLDAEFGKPTHQHHYRYLLIDRLADTESELSLIANEMLEYQLDPQLLAVIERPELLHDLDSCPLLVCLAEPEQPVNRELILASLSQINDEYLTTKQYVCGFLSSPLEPNELATQLLTSCLKAGKAISKNFLPFYEPFLLDLLWHSFNQPESYLGLLLPKDTTYFFVDTDGDCQQFHGIQDKSDFALRFANQTVRTYVQDRAVLNHLIIKWLELCDRQGHSLPPHSLRQLLTYYYDQQAKQLKDRQDRQAYVLFSLQYGDLTRHEVLSSIIQDVIKNEDKNGQLGYLLSQENKVLKLLIN